jgi:hypothetical protein
MGVLIKPGATVAPAGANAGRPACIPRRRREAQRRPHAPAEDGGCWGDVEALVTHWDGLGAGRKVAYAQMAALARCGGHGGGPGGF